MNLQPLFETQKILDQRIIKQHGLEGQDLLPQKILALQVELGECANEWRGFKFWSKNQKPNLYKEEIDLENDRFRSFNPLLEEYVDCLHFILSIGIEMDMEEAEVYRYKRNLEQNDNVVDSFMDVFQRVSELDLPTSDFSHTLSRFIELGEMLGFTWSQIEQAYYSKNEINHSRQDTGY